MNCYCFRINIYSLLLYISINEIKFWYESTESKKFCEEHMKPSYRMLTYINNKVIYKPNNYRGK